MARGSDHLFIEAAFLEKDKDTAKREHHLTACQAGTIARKAGVKEMTLFHHSRRYLEQAEQLQAEARDAYENTG